MNSSLSGSLHKITFSSSHIWSRAFGLVKNSLQYMSICLSLMLLEVFMLTFSLLLWSFFVLPVGFKKFSFWNLTNTFCQIFHFYLAPPMTKHCTKHTIFVFLCIMKIRNSGRSDLFGSSSHPMSTVQNINQLPVHYFIVYWTGTLCSA